MRLGATPRRSLTKSTTKEAFDAWRGPNHEECTNQHQLHTWRRVEDFTNWIGQGTLLKDVDAIHIAEFIDYRLGKGLKPTTVLRELTALSSLFR